MTVLRATGPGFLAERFMSESPLQHCSRLAPCDRPGGGEWPGAAVTVTLAPWEDWGARLADTAAFIASARGELERLRSRWLAAELCLDFPVNRRLGVQRQAHEFPADLLAACGTLGIDLRISYHTPDFAGAAERHPRIVVHPEICDGKPVIRGTRVLVRNLVDALARGQTLWQIQQDFPDVGAEDVAAAVAFIAEQAEHA
jgi:uncharacterized protein (DUF433 family)